MQESLTPLSAESCSHWTLPMDWLTVEPTLESTLTLECTCRGIQQATNLEEVQNLCIALTRQNWYQEQLLKQAISHIAEMDYLLEDPM